MIVIILYTLILLFTDKAAAGAMCMQALRQWYETMIPALFPMMLMSSILVDTGFAEKIGSLLNHTLLKFLHISNNGCYCLLTGLFFGFPMGAKTTADLYMGNGLTQKEAQYLLSFINCIGPMYTINLTHTLFPIIPLWKLLLGMYAIPLVYGILLRYTFYQKETLYSSEALTASKPLSLPDAIYTCVPKCGKSILMLGGYMVLFQLSFVTLDHFLKSLNIITNSLYPLLEITGGLFLLSQNTALPYILFYGTFTGACCHLQTYSFLKPAGLSMKKYLSHKAILSGISFMVGFLLSHC